MTDDLKNIVESLLFVSSGPLDTTALKKSIPDADAKAIRKVLAELKADYESRQGGFLLYEVAGGYQFRTRPEYKEWVKRLVSPAPLRLSQAALETLAIIAYHQPVIRSDVEHIRGVDSGAVIRSLLERKLIRILGKKEIPGRPMIYATTKRFLEVFNLKSLQDLPSLREIQDFRQESEAGEDSAREADALVNPEQPAKESGFDPEEASAPESPDISEDGTVSRNTDTGEWGQAAAISPEDGERGEAEAPDDFSSSDNNQK